MWVTGHYSFTWWLLLYARQTNLPILEMFSKQLCQTTQGLIGESIYFKPTQFQSEKAYIFGQTFILQKLQKNNRYPSVQVFSYQGLACVATFVAIRTNLKPDLISFPVHVRQLSHLSHWLTILSQPVTYIGTQPH